MIRSNNTEKAAAFEWLRAQALKGDGNMAAAIMLAEVAGVGSQHRVIKAMVHDILANSGRYTWTRQGLGMLRTYLSKDVRLHVWHKRLLTPGVSTRHTHPWAFSSHIVAGHVENVRFVVHTDKLGIPTNAQRLACGIGGGLVGAPWIVNLVEREPEHYSEGQTYYQAADEVHESRPADGTVTVITRDFLPDEQHANVYWPMGDEWRTAEPSTAADVEVADICRQALQLWF